MQCCEGILNGLLPDELLEPVHDGALPQEPPVILEHRSVCDRFTSAVRRAAYIPCNAPDFSRLRHLIITAYDIARDKIWALREEPAYFEEMLCSFIYHEPDTIPYEEGVFGKERNHPDDWAYSLGNLHLDAYLDVVQWNVLSDQLGKLGSLITNLQRSQTPTLSGRF